MFWRILKKDLLRKKTMNIILLAFITLSAMFLASSTNNLISIKGAVDYFLDISNTPDYTVITNNEAGDKEIQQWLKDSELVNEYEKVNSIFVLNDYLKINNDAEVRDYSLTTAMLIMKQPDKFLNMVDKKGEIFQLEQGEIVVSSLDADKNNLKVGDRILISIEDKKLQFTVKYIGMDAVMGNDMMGIKRLIISDEDYNILSSCKSVNLQTFYSIDTDDTLKFGKELKKQNFPINTTLDRSLVEKCYILEMVMSAILIIVSICLILISFLILRFTIIFTLQEDYREIGIMKAIGLRNSGVKSVYIIKYLAISIAGAFLGFITSFPFGNLLLGRAAANILMQDAGQNVLVNALSSITIILLVLIFCYRSTSKLNRFSAIEAIRNGSSGERYSKKGFIKLGSKKHMGAVLFMAINDILSNPKRYIVLVLTFIVGTMLIILPLNAVNTLKSENVLNLFGVAPSDVYIDTGIMQNIYNIGDKEAVNRIIQETEKDFNDNGVGVKLRLEVVFKLNMYIEKEDLYSVYTLQSLNGTDDRYELLDGYAPEHENEILLTEILAEKIGVVIGDSITVLFGKEEKNFLITGLYQSMNNMGEGARFSSKLNVDYRYLSGLFAMQGDFTGDGDAAVYIEKLKAIYPEHKFFTSKEYTAVMLGSIVDQMDELKLLILFVVLCINALITILMMKAVITKEKGEIAMLKSIGFRNNSIRLWQMARIVIVLVTSIILGIILSILSGPGTVGLVFKMMGANHIKLKIEPLEVYVLYPAIILLVTTFVAALSSAIIKKIDFKEINNME